MKRAFWLAVALAILTFFIGRGIAANILLFSSHISMVGLTAENPTSRWGGIVGTASGSATESNLPFTSVDVTDASILSTTFPGDNFLDGKHYYVAIPQDVEFNLTKVMNVTVDDLEEWGIFNSTNFPIFHPDYYSKSDNPKKTFCCNQTDVILGGVPFRAFVINLEQNVQYYLLKYDVGTTQLPMFLVKIDNYICYNGNACNFEFMLPVGKTYWFYIISKEPQVRLEVWIDGVSTTQMEQTALPYNLTVRATNLYTGLPVANVDVMVFEENGNNIFMPQLLSGKIARGMSVAKTNSDGYVSFIVAPTEYPTKDDYSIGVGLYGEDIEVMRRINLTVVNSGSIEFRKKYLSPTSLWNNAKTTVNTMNQLINSLYKWANEEKRAITYDVTFYTNGTYYFVNLSDYRTYQQATLKTGAPNRIRVNIKTPDGTPVDGYVVAKEEEGYLLFVPTLNATDISSASHKDWFFGLDDGTFFVIAPTSYSDAFSTVKLSVYDSNGAYLGDITFQIDRQLEPRTGGIYYENNDMKVIINAMNSVVYSLFYALN